MALRNQLGIFLIGSILLGSCNKIELADGISSDTTQFYEVPKGFTFPAKYEVQITYLGTQVMEKGLTRRIGKLEQKKYFPYMPFKNDFWGISQWIRDLTPREIPNYFSYFAPIGFRDQYYSNFITGQVKYKISNDSLFYIEETPLMTQHSLIAFGNFNGFYEYDNFIKCDDLYFTLSKTQHALTPLEVEEFIWLNADLFGNYQTNKKHKSIAVGSYKISYNLKK
jgi:hypothetical protein